jgi:hypothetical protein
MNGIENDWMSMAENHRSPAAYVIEVVITIDVEKKRSFSTLNK